MEDSKITQNTQQQPAATPTPEASGDQGEGRMFTQDDVNRIVSERLARERAKAEPSPEDTREADLRAKESRLSCWEYIIKEGFPDSLLDLFGTDDAEKFKADVERLDKIVSLPSRYRKPIPRIVAPTGGGCGMPDTPTLLAEAFKPPKI